jgi:hypothetical protein
MSTLLPVLTEYEKEHLSERQPLPERYVGLSDAEMTLTPISSCSAASTSWPKAPTC